MALSCHDLPRAISLLFLLLLAIGWTPANAQERLTGEAALKHPAGQLAVRAAELLAAAKFDELSTLRTTREQSEWKQMTAAERREFGESVKERAPDPKSFPGEIRQSGELTINGNTGVLGVPTDRGRVVTYFEREAGAWRIMSGPIVFPAVTEPANETRLEDSEILSHPIGDVALKYLDLIHAGRIDAAYQLATADAQAKWKSESSQERSESAAYLRRNLPTRAALEAALKAPGPALRGVLVIGGDQATLNILRSESKSTGPGQTTYTSSTVTLSFAKEGGQWRVAQ